MRSWAGDAEILNSVIRKGLRGPCTISWKLLNEILKLLLLSPPTYR